MVLIHWPTYTQGGRAGDGGEVLEDVLAGNHGELFDRSFR